ncbi:OmpA family protein [uncultured Aquimarina sp.]|uniref:OmpA family protein n=1 Tax=uncultured Aquimarina sp. TaxID=575652 RepID=UPI0026224F43|nr:OmpA family protein [uncultured Aquimarina sp.]
MKFSKLIILTIYLMHTVFLCAQEREYKKANLSYDNYAFKDAIESYKKIIKKGNAPIEIYKKLGDCYFFNSNLKDAAKWYLKMMEKKKELEKKGQEVTGITAEDYFRTSQSLKFLKEYRKADSILLKLNDLSNTDSRAKRLINNPDYLEKIAVQSNRYIIENLPSNSAFVDFAPSIYKGQLVFASERKQGKKNSWTKRSYLNLFSFKIESKSDSNYPKEFSKEISSRLHESTTSFNKQGTTIYFTRNNLLRSKFGKDSTGVNRLKIYRASKNNKSKWSDIEDLSINNDQYSIAHPTLSPDEKKLYFASDMPGGYGMADLYVVDINEDGSLGNPQNLGPEINTEGRDTFPFISSKGILYFASDGHLGLGGLDIFAVDLEKSYKEIYNIGEPINSPADDITFYIDGDTRKGYFASNRYGGRGNDDIYSFVETSPLITKCEGSLLLKIIDNKSADPISNTEIEITNKNGEPIFSGKTNDKGEAYINLECGDKTYDVITKKEDYESKSASIIVTRDNPFPSKTIKLKNNIPDKGIDLAKLLNLKPIYFASNKAVILNNSAKELDKIVNYMKEYPSIKIEIGSHTDSKGSDVYNLKLSKRRATSTANYIISKGINSSRVKSKGYGETVLINRCGNGIKCSKDEHAQNRRSEFIVVEN